MKFFNKILRKSAVHLSIILFVVFLIYKNLLNGFFQQDEWAGFGWYVLHRNLSFIDLVKFLFAPSVGHYGPLTNILQYNLLSLWGMNYTNFAAIGIALHLVVLIILYFVTKTIFRGNNFLAFVTTLLFGLLAAPYQGVGWVIADLSVLISSGFGLISFLLFYKYLDNKKEKYLTGSLLILIISLFFKEITIGLFLLYFIYGIIDFKSKSKNKYIYTIVLFGLVYFAFRVSMIFAPNITGDKLVTQTQSIRNIVYNFLTIPLKSITQTIIPIDFLKIISFKLAEVFPRNIVGPLGSPEFEIFAVKRVMEFLNILVGVFILGSIVLVVKKVRNLHFKEVFLIGVGWAVVNSFIFSIAPETSGVTFAVDSRNLYFTAIGISLLIVAMVNFFAKWSSRKIILILLPLVFFNIFWLTRTLSRYVEIGNTRKRILKQVQSSTQGLPQKAVFYIISDKPYYGLSEEKKILPFQSGLGQTLLVWYYAREHFPEAFFKDRFLWEIDSQGYQEFDGRGFGYFRDISLLKMAIKQYNLPRESIFAFSWNGNLEELTDITEEMRNNIYVKKN